MQCENHFCIYWDSGICLLDKISLDVQGSCQDCIYVELEEELLKRERKNALHRLRERDKNET